MTFKAYRSIGSDHTHENIAFNILHDILKINWSERDEPMHLIGNVFVDGQEIDAIILKRNAIIVIDFKNYGGELSFSENGKWKISGRTVKGGSKPNPYQQIRDNKYTLLNYLDKNLRFQSNPTLGHISGLCLFHQNIEFNPQSIPGKIGSWFHVVDMDSAYRRIEAIVSSQIHMSDAEIGKIIDQLDVPDYFPDGNPIEISFDAPGRIKKAPALELNTEQAAAFVQIKDWLDDKGCNVFSLQGAYYTGKSKMRQKVENELLERKITPIFLAPNVRAASLYKKNKNDDINSIYSWLYDKVPNGLRKGKQIYPIKRPEFDINKTAIIIFDSHLLGDDFFEMETKVYGSGQILTDFLNSFKLKKGGTTSDDSVFLLPKILLFGDPYQLKRASGLKDLVSCGIFKKSRVNHRIAELRSQDRDKNAPIERLDFQKALIEQINERKFLSLPKDSNEKIRAISKGEDTDVIVEKLLAWPKIATYLCAKNTSAQAVNAAIRKNYLAAMDPGFLIKGDVVEIYSPTQGLMETDKTLQAENQIQSGQFAKVISIKPEIESKSIILKGRENAVIVKFALARVELESGNAFNIEYLPDFLAANKPELPKDQAIALRVWAKEDADLKLRVEKEELDRLKNEGKNEHPVYLDKVRDYQQRHGQLILESRYTTVARLRYAYAMTVHRAQSYSPMSTIVFDGSSAHDTNNPATESYFRCLYTATTCTSDLIQIVNYPKLSLFSKTTWDFTPKKIHSISIKQSLFFDKSRQPSGSHIDILATKGFENTNSNLIALLLTVSDLISKSNWEIESVQQHKYIERYVFSKGTEKLTVDFSYNGKYDVSIGNIVVTEGPKTLEEEIKKLLYTDLMFKSQDVAFAFSVLSEHLAKKEWEIIPYKETNYKLLAIAQLQGDKIKLEIDIPAADAISKRGVISNVKIRQADNVRVVEQFKIDFKSD